MATTPFQDPLAKSMLGQSSSLSPWAGPYVTDMLGKGAALAGEDYQGYQGPISAGSSMLQNQAFQGLGALNPGGGFQPQSFTGYSPQVPQQTPGMTPNMQQPSGGGYNPGMATNMPINDNMNTMWGAAGNGVESSQQITPEMLQKLGMGQQDPGEMLQKLGMGQLDPDMATTPHWSDGNGGYTKPDPTQGQQSQTTEQLMQMLQGGGGFGGQQSQGGVTQMPTMERDPVYEQMYADFQAKNPGLEHGGIREFMQSEENKNYRPAPQQQPQGNLGYEGQVQNLGNGMAMQALGMGSQQPQQDPGMATTMPIYSDGNGGYTNQDPTQGQQSQTQEQLMQMLQGGGGFGGQTAGNNVDMGISDTPQGQQAMAPPQQGQQAMAPPQQGPGQSPVEQYMNPYLQASLNPQLDEAQRQSEIQRVNNAGRMSRAGAFGGGRQAIMDSENQRNLLRNMSDITGRGYDTAFQQGRQQFNTEQDLGLRASGQNQQYGLQALQAQMGAGQTQRDIAQEGIAANMRQFEQERDDPYKKVQFQQSLLQGLPISTQDYQYAETSPLSNFGGGAAGAGTFWDMFFGKDGQK